MTKTELWNRIVSLRNNCRCSTIDSEDDESTLECDACERLNEVCESLAKAQNTEYIIKHLNSIMKVANASQMTQFELQTIKTCVNSIVTLIAEI